MPTQTSGGISKKITRSYSVNPYYTGPDLETVLSSIEVRNEGIPNLVQFEYLKEVVAKSKIKFAKSFFKQLKVQGRQLNESWVEACKNREKDLFKILEVILMTEDYSDLVLVLNTAHGIREDRVYDLDSITWCPKNFKIFRLKEDEVLDVFTTTGQPKFYGTLFVSMLLVAKACKESRSEDNDLFNGLKQLALSIIEIARLYNETNPDDRNWKKQELNTFSILTSPPEAVPDEELNELFGTVMADIIEGRYPYIKDISKAIKSNRRYLESPFSDSDYYYSFRSDPAYIPGFKYRQSLFKSIVETDPLVGCSFDRVTGYVSHYNKKAPEGYKSPWISTIHIPNPGKYKTRAIHLALSSIQDRCCYIHNRISKVLNSMKTDCTRDQDKGRDFARLISSPRYREQRNYNSVLAYDWSNATDKMSQVFQEACLSLLFKPEVVEFWHEVSSCEKEFRFKDGERKLYTQICGQPQGLLGSFDAFAFAHHIIMLMTMKASGLEDSNPEDFYRVLGDDSIISSVKYDPSNKVGDNYCRICSWANMEINRSKSTEILSENMIAMVDFAKVTVLDGEYFSPIPSRVANRIGSKQGDYYSLTAALWLSLHGPSQKDWIESLVDRYYPDKIDNYLAKLLVNSGVMPAFKQVGFDNAELKNNPDTMRLALVFAYNKIKSSLLSGLLPDKTKENLDLINEKEQRDALSELIPEDLTEVWDKMEDVDHKINIAIETNLSKESVIRDLLNSSVDQAKTIAATLNFKDQEIDLMLEAISLTDLIITYDEDIEVFKDRIYNMQTGLKALTRLQYRSWYKQSSLDVMVMRKSIMTFKEQFASRTKQLEIDFRAEQERGIDITI